MPIVRIIRVASLVALITTLAHAAVAQESLRDRVRKEGDIGIVILNEYPGAEVADLVRGADLIAHVMVQGEDVRLSKDETKVQTDYTARPLTVLHQKGLKIQPGGIITMTKSGGTLVLDGRKVHAWEPDFPSLELGAEYVVFLKKDAAGSFLFQYGAQGAFTVEGGKVVGQVSRGHGLWKQQRGDKPATLDSFVQDVQESLLSLKKQ